MRKVAGFYTNAAGNFLTAFSFWDSTITARLWASTSTWPARCIALVCSVTALTCTQFDDPAGIGTTTFNGLNDLGQVVGFYVNGDGNTIGLLANAVPEPGSLGLLAAGLLGIGVALHRRKAG
jgi:hypothetical protein